MKRVYLLFVFCASLTFTSCTISDKRTPGEGDPDCSLCNGKGYTEATVFYIFNSYYDCTCKILRNAKKRIHEATLSKKTVLTEGTLKKTKANNALSEMVKELKTELPISFGNGVTCTDVRLSAKSVTYVYQMGYSNVHVSKSASDNFVRQMASSSEDFRELLENIVTSRRNLVFRYEGSQTQEIVFKAEELEEMLE